MAEINTGSVVKMVGCWWRSKTGLAAGVRLGSHSASVPGSGPSRLREAMGWIDNSSNTLYSALELSNKTDLLQRFPRRGAGSTTRLLRLC